MNKSTAMIVFLVLIIIVLGGGLFLLSEKLGSGTAVSTSNLESPKVSEPVVVKDTGSEIDTNLVSDGWKTYSNADLKFTINYPEKSYSFYGACEEKVEGERSSFRPKVAEIPVGIFEDEDGVFISHTYAYKLGDETSVDGTSYFGSCTKTPVTLASLKEQSVSWHVIAKEVPTRSALESFIKERFGSGCSIGTMTATSENSKVYNVKIQTDGLDLGESKCGLNYIYVLKYVPDTNMVYTYNLGQAYTFAKTADGMQSYDQEMSASFQPIL